MVDLRKERIRGPVANPTMADVLNRLKREVMLSMNCVQIGTIQSFNSAKGTAKISINVKRKLLDGDDLEYPVLDDVPCFFLYGGTSKITMPIASGDSCIVIFADRSFDDWFLSGQVKAPDSTRCHSLSDGIALVGLKNLSQVSVTPMDSICINGGSKKVAVKNNSTNLKAVITAVIKLIEDLEALIKTIQCGSYAMTVPNPATGFVNFETSISTCKTTLGNLLDEGTS